MIYLVGAGPGRADLLTVRAARVLAKANVVLYDRLVSPEVLDLVNPAADLLFVGKRDGEQEPIQQAILEELARQAHQHPHVVRLKGGDPMVFGRGAEEWQYLIDQGLEVELVPGISSALSVPSLAGIPPTFRGIANGFAVITGHVRDGFNEELKRYAQADTLIILMGTRHRARIADLLIAAGRDAQEPACFIENGSTPRERFHETVLGELGSVRVESPAVLVIGQVVRLRERLVPLLASGCLEATI
ncbi:MAG: uroporphyrinogen-III C-methyltransferase [Bryobacteraceae bacterium]|nr:uroporphyrinogen-III C-methyltransferase [Bryobacteraceae bacterium]